MKETPDTSPSSETFATTHWTRVLAATGDSEMAREALSDLCRDYYLPVLAFLRREGRSEDEARELAHEFFARVLAGDFLARADPERGRFRSYLLGALKHFIANRRARAGREKRGGGRLPDSLDDPVGAGHQGLAAGVASPEAAFDREWALNLLSRAFDTLKAGHCGEGEAGSFEVLKPWLTPEGASRSQAEAARELGLNEGAVRVAIHRLRKRFRAAVKAELARTLHESADVTSELRALIEALS